MGGKVLSEDLKWRIIYLHRDGYSTKKITQLLYVSKSMVNKTILIFNKWGCVNNPLKGKQGRRKFFNRYDLNVSLFYFLHFTYKILFITFL